MSFSFAQKYNGKYRYLYKIEPIYLIVECNDIRIFKVDDSTLCSFSFEAEQISNNLEDEELIDKNIQKCINRIKLQISK